jgi:hypothetical protein
MSNAVELTFVPDIYADNISHVENLGTCVRTVYFTWQQIGDRWERVVVAKIIRPIASIESGVILRLLSDQVPIIQQRSLTLRH